MLLFAGRIVDVGSPTPAISKWSSLGQIGTPQLANSIRSGSDKLAEFGKSSSVCLDQGDNFITAVSLSPRVIEEFVDASHHRAALGCANYPHATTSREVE